MTDQPKKHAVRHVVKAVYSDLWAIDEPKLEAIRELLELRQDGYGYTPEQIQARIGAARQEAPQMQVIEGVAVIPIHGVMAPRMNMMMEVSGGTSTQMAARSIRQAINDNSITAIVLDIDSPGGQASGTQELAELVSLARESKPVKAVATTMAASAAYWVASAADELIVSPSAQVGSIGVFSVYTDESRAYENAGIEHTVIRSVENKARPSGYEPLDDKSRANLQESVNDIHRAFVGAVAQGRGVSVEYVEENFGKGKSFMGTRAVALGMADRVGTLEQVIGELTTGSAPAPSKNSGGKKMSKALREKAVARGVCNADATDEQFEAAIAKMLDDQAIVTGTKPGHTTEDVTGVKPRADAAAASDIMAAVRIAAFPSDFDRLAFATELSDAGLSMGAVVRKIGEKSAEFNKATGAAVRVVGDAGDNFKAAARDAMLMRANGDRWDENTVAARDAYLAKLGRPAEGLKPAVGARESFNLRSMPRLAEECLIRDGVPQSLIRQLSPMHIAQAALGTPLSYMGINATGDTQYNSSGMFASVMLDAANVVMRKGYDSVEVTYPVWAKQGQSLSDFKAINKVLTGELADPKAIPENGEFPETTFQDEHESYKLTVWGSMFSVTWQSIVNDHIGAFTDIPNKQGRAMRRKQNRIVYNVLKDNAKLQDTVDLFHNTHGNNTTGAGAPAVGTLNTLEGKMIVQTSLTGAANADAQALNIKPAFIIAPPALIGTIDELLGSTSYAVSNGNAGIINRWHQRLTHVNDAELATAFGGLDTTWYLATNPGDVDTIEYAFLQGLESPALDRMPGWNVLGTSFRIYQAFTAKAIDYRGLQRHVGA